jgi:hypothetical protein
VTCYCGKSVTLLSAQRQCRAFKTCNEAFHATATCSGSLRREPSFRRRDPSLSPPTRRLNSRPQQTSATSRKHLPEQKVLGSIMNAFKTPCASRLVGGKPNKVRKMRDVCAAERLLCRGVGRLQRLSEPLGVIDCRFSARHLLHASAARAHSSSATAAAASRVRARAAAAAVRTGCASSSPHTPLPLPAQPPRTTHCHSSAPSVRWRPAGTPAGGASPACSSRWVRTAKCGGCGCRTLSPS